MKHTYKVKIDDWGKVKRTIVTATTEREAIEIAIHALFEKHEIADLVGEEKWIDICIKHGYYKATEIKAPERKYPYYVTTYSCYPIYEPAEGGIYYSGSEISDVFGFNNRKDAIKYINKLYRKYKAEPLEEKWTFHTNADNTVFGANSHYIGDGWFVKLERKLGSCVHGYEPYC